jgi:hypothetical protein
MDDQSALALRVTAYIPINPTSRFRMTGQMSFYGLANSPALQHLRAQVCRPISPNKLHLTNDPFLTQLTKRRKMDNMRTQFRA